MRSTTTPTARSAGMMPAMAMGRLLEPAPRPRPANSKTHRTDPPHGPHARDRPALRSGCLSRPWLNKRHGPHARDWPAVAQGVADDGDDLRWLGPDPPRGEVQDGDAGGGHPGVALHGVFPVGFVVVVFAGVDFGGDAELFPPGIGAGQEYAADIQARVVHRLVEAGLVDEIHQVAFGPGPDPAS